jgi:hypothetical protein
MNLAEHLLPTTAVNTASLMLSRHHFTRAVTAEIARVPGAEAALQAAPAKCAAAAAVSADADFAEGPNDGTDPTRLDQCRIDSSIRLPASDKRKGLKLLWFFNEALRGYLPDDILAKNKQEFRLPFWVWVNGTMGRGSSRPNHCVRWACAASCGQRTSIRC